jgi:heavy metal translocating P-type ATPase
VILTGRAWLRPVLVLAALVGGLTFLAVPGPRHTGTAHLIWTTGLWLTGVPLLIRTAIGLARGRFAADLVAALAILGAMALGESFAGLVIVLMQTGGEALERIAARRASRAVRALEEDAPRIAHRLEGDVAVDIPVDDVVVGDRLLVRPGEMVPCDGVVLEGRARVDVSRITGEPIPESAVEGSLLRSGALVQDSPLVVEARALASASLYARIVELVRTAQASKAPIQRVADRYAVWFTPLTLVICLVTWLWSHDAARVLAVLVVATPCPLILATPVAVVGGINRAARGRIIIRHGGALEALAAVNTAVFDKTGTLTIGRPEVSGVLALAPYTEVELLRLAAAVERGSGHSLARTVVAEAEARSIPAVPAQEIREFPGRGVEGVVEGRTVVVGAASLLRERTPPGPDANGAALRAYVAVDGGLAGSITFADRVRDDAAAMVRHLRQLGFQHIALLSGDDQSTAQEVAAAVGISMVEGDLLPEGKARYVSRLQAEGRRVLVVGDGTNDAPALASATVGLALAAHGGGIAAEAADVVLLGEDLSRIPEAVALGRRTLRIARQSLLVGLGLSTVAMGFASLGHIPPAVGALLQEGIDIAVILNALRTAQDP